MRETPFEALLNRIYFAVKLLSNLVAVAVIYAGQASYQGQAKLYLHCIPCSAPFLKVLKQPDQQPKSERITFPANLPTISETTQQLIHETLSRTNNNQSCPAARLLGITQGALSRRLSKHN